MTEPINTKFVAAMTKMVVALYKTTDIDSISSRGVQVSPLTALVEAVGDNQIDTVRRISDDYPFETSATIDGIQFYAIHALSLHSQLIQDEVERVKALEADNARQTHNR